MRAIADLVDLIEEELEAAKDYAERSLEMKSKNNETWTQRFKEMANDELKHSVYIHDRATEEINRLSEVFVPPVEMQEAWDKSHAKYVERVAWIRQMLAM